MPHLGLLMDNALTLIVMAYDRPALLQQTLKTLKAYTKGYGHLVVMASASPCIEDIRAAADTEVRAFEEKTPLANVKRLADEVDTPYFAYCHDDVGFVPGNEHFWTRMMWPLQDPQVAGTGPTCGGGDGYQNYLRTEMPEYTKVHNIHTPLVVWRTDTYRSAGGHDLDTGTGSEVDLCLRMRRSGYSLVIARDAYLNHRGGATVSRWTQGHVGTFLIDMGERMDNILIKKHGVAAYYEHQGQAHEWNQTVICHGWSFQSLQAALSRGPEAWKPNRERQR